ncbi:ABC transporter ATP-binding protein [Halobacterium zhouii]|uniref:ABC transporter ATP-binding protein n=1 Tax=Halobacterium zhouii TaxID=2902624 RepID=UPI001E4697A5|nr:ABC transporter ATP-binding protein [Halobacterium zhouii]
MSDPLLSTRGLETQFDTPRGVVEAVDGVDLDIGRGEIAGLVGESGSGKSVLAESTMGLVDDPGEVVGGEVRFRSADAVETLARECPDAVRTPDDPVESGFVVVEDVNVAPDVRDDSRATDGAGAAGDVASNHPAAVGDDVEVESGYVDLRRADEAAMQHIRGGSLAMVFQDPMNSLNPTLSVGEQIAETVRLHQDVGESVSLGAEFKRKLLGAAKNSDAWQRAIEMLEAVEIPEPERRAEEYPHEFSGGMRQRAMIAMALSCEPDLLVADEPTTALDVTIQAQILDELAGLKEAFDTSILLITHDLAVVAETCDVVNVMYAGEIVERADARELFANPQHPYTQGLIASTPKLEAPTDELEPIPGNVPDLVDVDYACHFAPRCPEADRECYEREPDFREVGDGGGHEAACLRRGPEEDQL